MNEMYVSWINKIVKMSEFLKFPLSSSERLPLEVQQLYDTFNTKTYSLKTDVLAAISSGVDYYGLNSVCIRGIKHGLGYTCKYLALSDWNIVYYSDNMRGCMAIISFELYTTFFNRKHVILYYSFWRQTSSEIIVNRRRNNYTYAILRYIIIL